MRKETLTRPTKAVIKYPDAYCMAFNPQQLTINLPSFQSYKAINVIVGNYPISIVPMKDMIVQLASAMQIQFDSIKQIRSKTFKVTINLVATSGQETKLFEFTTIAIYGGVNFIDRFPMFGKFTYNSEDHKATHTRNVDWFKNYPFTLTLIRPTVNDDIYVKNNGSLLNVYPFLYRFDGEESGEIDVQEGVCPEVDEVFYSTELRCFVARGEDGDYYAEWNAQGEHGSNIDYNAIIYSDNEILPRNDRMWIYGDKVYRYDTVEEEMQEILNYSGLNAGIVDMQVSQVYEDYSGHLSVNMEWDENDAKMFNDLFDFVSDKQGIPDPFDSSFDLTFHPDYSNIKGMHQAININIREEKDGCYLRWLDRFGGYQYYLFVSESITDKTKIASGHVHDDNYTSRIKYPNSNRSYNIEGEKTVKAAAVSLNWEKCKYVSSIVVSPIVDLYLGKTRSGIEIWCPVSVIAGSYKQSTDKMLQDYEIQFTLPTSNTQTL